MSSCQQKMLFAACLFGALAVASAQMNFDWNACQKGFQTELDRYRENLMSSGQRFTQNLQNVGQQATDISPIQKDIDKLSQSFAQMAQFDQGFDVRRFMRIYMENLTTIGSLMSSSFRTSLVSGTMDNYLEFANSIYGSNTQFLERVTESCMPNRMRQLPQKPQQ